MRNMMKKAAQNVKAVAVRAGMLMKDTKGENYVDTAVKILIAVVLAHCSWQVFMHSSGMW